jgi:hypothetical protein
MLVITSGTEEQSALAKQLEDGRSESGVDDAFVGSLSGSDGRFHVIIPSATRNGRSGTSPAAKPRSWRGSPLQGFGGV